MMIYYIIGRTWTRIGDLNLAKVATTVLVRARLQTSRSTGESHFRRLSVQWCLVHFLLCNFIFDMLDFTFFILFQWHIITAWSKPLGNCFGAFMKNQVSSALVCFRILWVELAHPACVSVLTSHSFYNSRDVYVLMYDSFVIMVPLTASHRFLKIPYILWCTQS